MQSIEDLFYKNLFTLGSKHWEKHFYIMRISITLKRNFSFFSDCKKFPKRPVKGLATNEGNATLTKIHRSQILKLSLSSKIRNIRLVFP